MKLKILAYIIVGILILVALALVIEIWANEPDPSEYMRHYKGVGY